MGSHYDNLYSRRSLQTNDASQLTNNQNGETMTKLTTQNNNNKELIFEEVKKFIDPKGQATPQELTFFFELCKERNLNPMLKEVYFIKYGSGQATIVVGVDTFVARANDHSDYEGYKSGWIVGEENNATTTDVPFGNILGAYCEVFRTGKQPTRATVRFAEYSTGKNRWATAPWQMIEKVAISSAHRKAYPKYFAQLYGWEEMDQAKTKKDDQDDDNNMKDITPKTKKKSDNLTKTLSAVGEEYKNNSPNENRLTLEDIINQINQKFATCEEGNVNQDVIDTLNEPYTDDIIFLSDFAQQYKENQEILNHLVQENQDEWKALLSPSGWNELIAHITKLIECFNYAEEGVAA